MDDFKLGDQVTFRKYGAQQAGTITAVKRVAPRVETVFTVENPEGEVSSGVERTEYRVDYSMKNGNEAREWMRAGALTLKQ